MRIDFISFLLNRTHNMRAYVEVEVEVWPHQLLNSALDVASRPSRFTLEKTSF
jgi:hypothetical protein